MLHMLDTDTVSYLVKGRSASIASHLRNTLPEYTCISVITQAELLYGLKRLPPGHRLQLAVRQFLKMVQVLMWDSDAATWYADIRHQLISDGQPIGDMDMMIAAHSLGAGAILVSNNQRHFARIKAPLQLVNWVDEYTGHRAR
jgi:tRNA(fMet)-specific endonuclease VapC